MSHIIKTKILCKLIFMGRISTKEFQFLFVHHKKKSSIVWMYDWTFPIPFCLLIFFLPSHVEKVCLNRVKLGLCSLKNYHFFPKWLFFFFLLILENHTVTLGDVFTVHRHALCSSAVGISGCFCQDATMETLKDMFN